MTADIDHALGGFDSGVIPNLSLPEVISNHSSGHPTDERKKTAGGARGLGTGRSQDDLSDAPEWWSANPEKIPEWGLPEGKTFRDFFSPELKENFTNWPHFKHHRHPKVPDKKPLCLKYQAGIGNCRAGCRLAHVKASSMDPAAKEKVAARFLEIYKKQT
jgi:hypothetical protein